MTQSQTDYDLKSATPASTVACMDDVVRIRVHSAAHMIAIMLLSSMALLTGAVGLYVIKSAAGIDLMQGPSLFHALFY